MKKYAKDVYFSNCSKQQVSTDIFSQLFYIKISRTQSSIFIHLFHSCNCGSYLSWDTYICTSWEPTKPITITMVFSQKTPLGKPSWSLQSVAIISFLTCKRNHFEPKLIRGFVLVLFRVYRLQFLLRIASFLSPACIPNCLPIFIVIKV